MSGFKPLLPHIILPKENRGPNKPTPGPKNVLSVSAMIRDNLTLSSWLLFGGLLQGIAITTLGPMTLIPTAVVILYRVIDHLLMATGIIRNRYMDGVLHTKFSGQYPRPDGSFAADPAAESVCVFLLGASCNHPLGILAPGVRELSDKAQAMVDAMTADSEKYGVLGTSSWIKREEAARNELMYMFYLRDYESLHRFAHDSLHMEGVQWWSKIVKDHPYVAIYHETYNIPKGQWENIYINSHPTGMGNTWFPLKGDEKGSEGVNGFARSVVDARSGALRSAAKRLQFKWLEEAEKEGNDLYDKTFIQ
ncbi:hypothetical protein DPV78_008224 [Talaromyces pinophilus]|nr:hypothetical protein DPV78_008224 [Talaromyces pinophilus]